MTNNIQRFIFKFPLGNWRHSGNLSPSLFFLYLNDLAANLEELPEY